MKRSRIYLIILLAAVAICAFALAACAKIGYSGNHSVPDATQNEVLFIERNKLSFALGMEIDEYAVIENCNCTFSDANGNKFRVTAESLASGAVKCDSFDLNTVGSNKQISLSYKGAVNYIYYDVNDYIANFYLDEEQTELYQTVKAQAQLSNTLGLAVWVNLIQTNISTDELIRETNADRAERFDGWLDSSGNRATGLYTLAPPVTGNERVINFHAHYLSETELADLKLSFDDRGRRVFSGYTGSEDTVRVPEGVTYIDVKSALKNFSFKNLYIPSTAYIDVPFLTGINSEGLESIAVDLGNIQFASYNGALYSKDFSTLYFMPSDCKETTFHTSLTVIASYACAYWRVTEVVIPESVATLQHYSFAYSLLENVHGLENVKTIQTGVFYGSHISTFDGDGKAEYVALSGEDSGKFILIMMLDKSITEYKVIDGTIGIAGDAFLGCADLVSIDLGDELISIGGSAFSGCSSLESIVFPSTLKKLGSSVFYNCSALKSVTGLTDVTYVDDNGNEYGHTLPSSIFRGCSSLTSAILPDGLEIIGASAFYDCSALNSLVIPDTVTDIGSSCFYRCTALKTVELPKGLQSLGTSVFSSAGLESIDLSVCEELTVLPERCFYGTKLTTIAIPDWINAIPAYCFYTVSTLTSITFGKVTTIEERAFYGCTKLPDINLDGVEYIGPRAFASCTSLTEVVLPDSVRHVGGYVFQSCSKLQKLTLGAGVEEFGVYPFDSDGITFGAVEPPMYTCNALESISVSENNPYFKSIDGILYGSRAGDKDFGEASVLYCVPPARENTLLQTASTTRVILPYAVHNQKYLTTVVLNDGMENIGKGAFYNSANLQSLSLPATVTNIGASILLNCPKVTYFYIAEGNEKYSSDGHVVYEGTVLTTYFGDESVPSDITIKDGITEIQSGVFMNKTNIMSVTISDSVTTIGDKAFSGCSGIQSLHIGAGLQPFDYTVFAYLQSLNTITISADNPYFTVENNILYSKDGKLLILAPACGGMTELNIKEGVTEICDYAFSYHKTLKKVEIPATVKKIGDYAFYECRAIESLRCSEALESIGAYAFAFDSNNAANVDTRRNCDTLKTIIFFGNLKSIGNYAFNGHYGIENTFFKMTVAEYNALSKGTNSVYFTEGIKDEETGEYYNNNGKGIIKALYSEEPPTIFYNGFEWFYFDEDGTPKLYQTSSDEQV
ncbi:MAG: leucine-rich repeat domain-containing protein [Clostridiales bacterium]|nr:leucine-rich repeat domain-containing protein [Clostridiales bacterium]